MGKDKESDPTNMLAHTLTGSLSTVYPYNVHDVSVVYRWCVGGMSVTHLVLFF